MPIIISPSTCEIKSGFRRCCIEWIGRTATPCATLSKEGAIADGKTESDP